MLSIAKIDKRFTLEPSLYLLYFSLGVYSTCVITEGVLLVKMKLNIQAMKS